MSSTSVALEERSQSCIDAGRCFKTCSQAPVKGGMLRMMGTICNIYIDLLLLEQKFEAPKLKEPKLTTRQIPHNR